MEQEIKLAHILYNDNFALRPGQYIQVTTVWTEGLPKKNDERKRCRFILSDGETLILATLILNKGQDSNARNVFQKLKKNSCQWKIQNFRVENNVREEWRIFNHQSKQILLSTCTPDIVEVQVPATQNRNQMLAIKFPFEFTKLEDVDERPLGSMINLIGCAMKILKNQTSKDGRVKYDKVTLGASRSMDPNKVEFERDVALFGDSMKKIPRKMDVYMILNVKVAEWKRNRSLQSTGSTIILKLNSVEELPPACQQQEYIKKLFAKKRVSRSALSAKNAGGAASGNDNAPEVFVQDSFLNELLNPDAVPVPYSPTHPGYFTTTGGQEIPNPAQGQGPTQNENGDQENLQPSSSLDSPSGRQENAEPDTSNGHHGEPSQPSASNGTQNQNGHQEEDPQPSTSRGSTSTSPRKRNLEESSPSRDDAKVARREKDLERFPKKSYNFVDNFEPLHVQGNIKPASEFMDTDNNSYRMRSKPRGIALIINNYYFPEKDRDYIRQGTMKDVEYLTDALQFFGFKVTTKHEVTSEDLPGILHNFKASAKTDPDSEVTDMDACFVAILSHGAHGLVEMHDGKFVRLPNDIIHQFDKKAFPEFGGKPKMFLLQLCQDIPSEKMISQIQKVTDRKEDDVELENMIECYSATSGTPAARDRYMGSPFIYVLVDTLMEHAHDTDLETILEVVQDRLTRVQRTDKNLLHCEWKRHRFNKKLYFNPGL